jgi:hypothetical protein
LNANECAFYSTNTSSNSVDAVYIQKNTARDLQNISLIRTKNEINAGANYTKSKDSFFILICNANNLKLAFYQLKSNLKMCFSATSKSTLYNINEKWFSKTSQLLLEHKYEFNIKEKIPILKKKKMKKTKFLTLTDFKNKIIEKAVLNYIEPILEGT